MNVFHSLWGMVDVEVTSADIPSALIAITKAGISLYSIQRMDDLTANIRIRREAYPILKTICEKRGDTLRILSRTGMYWSFKALWKRPVLVMGIMFLLALMMLLPTRVLFIRVDGNDEIPARKILEAAENCGIRFGASRREVRSERVKNRLLQEMPQLQWAGINTSGCVAVISVRERSIAEGEVCRSHFGNIVADREGIILDCTVTRGNLLCSPGQAVSKGQVLISGYTDCGAVVQFSCAEGEIYARTKREITAVMPAEYNRKQYDIEKRNTYSLLIGKKRINLWKDSGIWDSTCGRIYEENYITLPGGFVLPLGWSVDTCFIGATVSDRCLETEADAVLREFSEQYLKGQMIAGTVLSENASVTQENDVYRLEGEYVCTEIIGKLQTEQIGETNGENG